MKGVSLWPCKMVLRSLSSRTVWNTASNHSILGMFWWVILLLCSRSTQLLSTSCYANSTLRAWPHCCQPKHKQRSEAFSCVTLDPELSLQSSPGSLPDLNKPGSDHCRNPAGSGRDFCLNASVLLFGLFWSFFSLNEKINSVEKWSWKQRSTPVITCGRI